MIDWTQNQYHNPKITQIINTLTKIQMHYQKLEQYELKIPDLTKERIQELIKGKTDCLICSERIAVEDDIWQCNTCWKSHHLSCITKWILTENQHLRQEIALFNWKCPHCTTNYAGEDITDIKSNCYCTQNYYSSNLTEISFEPLLTLPHGCEAICSKEICKHIKACPLLCHPGPHVECIAFESKQCVCGQTTRPVPCSDSEVDFSCELICNKELPCLVHRCKEKCHKGPCKSLFLNQSCDECSSETKEELTAFIRKREREEGIDLNINLSFIIIDCIFNNQMPCNRHLADVKTEQAQLHLKRIMKNNTMNIKQLLSLFIPLCKVEVVNSCNCTNKSKTTQCYLLNYSEGLLNLLNIQKESKMGQCNTICSAFLHCRNHVCRRKCCGLNKVYITNYSIQDPHGYHLCHLKCGKMLDCKRHQCEETCHRGKCPPCSQKIEKRDLICYCGKTIMNPPYPCNYKIKCNKNCSKALHCGHFCEEQCHEGYCPPCNKLLSQLCLCQKDFINIHCSESGEAMKCQKRCEKVLNCGVHACPLICHMHDDKYDQDYNCELKCLRSLLTCEHPCQMKCHGQSPCDETQCKFLRVIKCKCRLTEKSIPCSQVKQGLIEVPCDNECFQKRLQTQIKISFEGIEHLTKEKILLLFPNAEQKFLPEIQREEVPLKYHNSLINYAKTKIYLIIKIENALNSLLLSSQFEPMSISLKEKDIEPITDWLIIYHRVKILRRAPGIIISDISSFNQQRHPLSLIALLFKHNLFDYSNKALKKCYQVYHPFAFTVGFISDKNYIYIEGIIQKSGIVSRNDYYLQEKKEGEYFICLFNASIGKKLSDMLRTKTTEFPQCYSHEYYQCEKDSAHLEDYLTNQSYYNYLVKGYDDSLSQECSKKKEEEEKESLDEDGFIAIKTKRKAK